MAASGGTVPVVPPPPPELAAAAPAGATPDKPSPGASPTHRRHGPRHPSGAEEDWDLSSDEERAAGAAAVITTLGTAAAPPPGGGSGDVQWRGGRAADQQGGGVTGGGGGGHVRSRSLEIEGYPTLEGDLPALLDLSLWRQEMLAIRTAAVLALSALLAYAFVFAPSGLPSWRHEARLLATLGYDNAPLFALLVARVLQAAAVAPLMVPAMHSANEISLWPFLVAAPLLGSSALLAYLAVYRAPKRAVRLPPRSAELRHGIGGRVLRVFESRAFPAALLAAQLALAALAACCNATTWGAFLQLLRASRIAHLCAVDATITAIIAAAAAQRDSRLRAPRRRGGRQPAAAAAAAALAAVPLVGPCLYLLTRPITGGSRRPSRPAGARRAAGTAGALPAPPVLRRQRRRGAVATALYIASAVLFGLPAAVATFALSILVVLLPSRNTLRRRLSSARRRIRRVASFVFQGTHIESGRVPIRQFSVRSDHGVQEDSDPDHPNSLAAATLAAVAALRASEEAAEARARLGRGARAAADAALREDDEGVGGGAYGDHDEGWEADEEEDDMFDDEEEEGTEEGDETEEGSSREEDEDEEWEEDEVDEVEGGRAGDYSDEDLVTSEPEAAVLSAGGPPQGSQQRGAVPAAAAGPPRRAVSGGKGAAAAAAGPPTPAARPHRNNTLQGRAQVGEHEEEDDVAAGGVRDAAARGGAGSGGAARSSPAASGATAGSRGAGRAAKVAALQAIHELAVAEHPRASHASVQM